MQHYLKLRPIFVDLVFVLEVSFSIQSCDLRYPRPVSVSEMIFYVLWQVNYANSFIFHNSEYKAAANSEIL